MRWPITWNRSASNRMNCRLKSATFCQLPTKMLLAADVRLGVSSQASSKRRSRRATTRMQSTGRSIAKRWRQNCKRFDTILGLLDANLIPKAGNGESKVFYQKMKADYYRYIAEFTDGDKKSKAGESARQAYQDAQNVAE